MDVVSDPAPMLVIHVVKIALSGNFLGASCCKRKSFDIKSCPSVDAGSSDSSAACLRLAICCEVNCAT